MEGIIGKRLIVLAESVVQYSPMHEMEEIHSWKVNKGVARNCPKIRMQLM